MRRSSSDPSLSATFPSSPPRPARPLSALLSALRRRAPALRRRHAVAPPPPPAPAAPADAAGSFGDSVGADTKSDRPSDPELASDDGPFPLRYARRNQTLRFLEIDADGRHARRMATRPDILAEVRQNWDCDADDPRNRLPLPRPPVRPPRDDSTDRPLDAGRARRPRRGGGAGSGRMSRNASWKLTPGTPGCELRPVRNRLTARDMRQIDTAFMGKSAIWVREDAILVSLEEVRAIIMHNKLFLFNPEKESVKKPIFSISKRLSDRREDWFMPFEFVALEGILIHACIVLEGDFQDIEPGLMGMLRDLPQNLSREQLEKLRQQEQRLGQYYSRVRHMQSVLQSVLDEDEDMADMYLTEKRRNPGLPRNPVDHDEVEMMFETYMQNVDDLTTKAGLLDRAIDDAENLIEIHLDTTQNRLLQVDLIIRVITTILAFGTMITAMFGMNFPLPADMQRLPRSQFYFVGCVGIMFAVMIAASVMLAAWFRKQGLYRGGKSRWRSSEVMPESKIGLKRNRKLFKRKPGRSNTDVTMGSGGDREEAEDWGGLPQ